MKFKQGSIVTFSEGPPGGLGFYGPYRVKRSFDCNRLVAQYRAIPGRQGHHSPDNFVKWLAEAGCIEDVESHTWHLGDSPRHFNPEFRR